METAASQQLWRRLDVARTGGEPATCRVDARSEAETAIVVSPPPDTPYPALYEVELDVSTSIEPGAIPLIGRRLHLVGEAQHGPPATGNRFSLPPEGGRLFVPVVVAGQAGELVLHAIPGDRASVDVLGCDARRIPAPIKTLERLLPLPIPEIPHAPYPITDVNWENGIRLGTAAFVVRTGPQYEGVFEPGKIVSFSGSGDRVITIVNANPTWTEVYVEGNPLDPQLDGYPNRFSVRPAASQ